MRQRDESYYEENYKLTPKQTAIALVSVTAVLIGLCSIEGVVSYLCNIFF